MSESIWGVPPAKSTQGRRGADGGHPRRDSPSRLPCRGAIRHGGQCDGWCNGLLQNARNAPTLNVFALFSTPFCASALMSVSSASMYRLQKSSPMVRCRAGRISVESAMAVPVLPREHTGTTSGCMRSIQYSMLPPAPRNGSSSGRWRDMFLRRESSWGNIPGNGSRGSIY